MSALTHLPSRAVRHVRMLALGRVHAAKRARWRRHERSAPAQVARTATLPEDAQIGDYLQISLHGDFTSTPQARALLTAYTASCAGSVPVPVWLLQLEGMSGRRYRALANEYVRCARPQRYLEVGSWSGSTACSVLWDSTMPVTCIDNWSQFGGPREEFVANTKRARPKAADSLTLIDADFRQVDLTTLGSFDFYLFDGPHSAEDQYDGVARYLPVLTETFTLFTDDWNWADVRAGTRQALRDNGVKVIAEIQVRTSDNNVHPQWSRQRSEWHNGYFFAVCSKPSTASA